MSGVFRDANELSDALDSLNFDAGIDTAGVVVGSVFYLAYATDPDGEWFFENVNPMERFAETEDGEMYYDAVNLNTIAPKVLRHGARIIWPEGETK